MALSEIEQEIFDYLKAKALEPTGLAPVQSAIKRFMAKGLRAVAEPTKRQFIPRQWIEAAYIRQRGKCNICRGDLRLTEAAGDHIVPVSVGGRHAKGNIAAVHGVKSEINCNSVKGPDDLLKHSRKTGLLLKDVLPEEEIA